MTGQGQAAQSFSFDDKGAAIRLAQALNAAGARAGLRTGRIVAHYGALLATQVKANASGRPGPRAPTGDYRRSITLRQNITVGRESTYEATVGTNRPQGRRLEFGFRGTDSKGRSYNQPAYPHFGPAFDRIYPRFLTAIAQLPEDLDDKL